MGEQVLLPVALLAEPLLAGRVGAGKGTLLQVNKARVLVQVAPSAKAGSASGTPVWFLLEVYRRDVLLLVSALPKCRVANRAREGAGGLLNATPSGAARPKARRRASLASPPLSHVKNRTSASTQSPPGRHGGDQGAARRGVGDDAHDLQGRACAPTPSPSRHTRGRATPPSPARCRRRTRSRHTECQQQGERRTNGVWVSLPRCGASRRPAGVQQGSGRQTTRAGPRRNTVVPATTRRRSD